MKNLVLFLLVLATLTGCAGTQQTTDLTQDANTETVEGMPDWFLTPPQDPNYLFTVATATSRDMQTAVSKSAQMARADMSRQIETKVDGLQKSFTEEVGLGDDSELMQQFTDVSKSVASQTLNGSKISEKKILKEGNIYRAYVMVQMPIGPMQEELLSQIKQRENMATRFRASKSFEELEKEVEKLNAAKTEN